MTTIITRLYKDYADAERAVRRLENAGVSHNNVSVVANNSEKWYRPGSKVDRDHDGVDDRAEGAGTGAGVGAGLGGAAGLLAGLGLLAIPGLGPVVAAGWLASTAAGAAAGAATGGIIGALTQAGLSKDEASRFAEGVRRGGALVSVRASEQDRARIEALLNESSVDIQTRSAAWQSTGWTGFDAASPPLAPDDIRRERELYSADAPRR
jgi:hypothetical protein